MSAPRGNTGETVEVWMQAKDIGWLQERRHAVQDAADWVRSFGEPIEIHAGDCGLGRSMFPASASLVNVSGPAAVCTCTPQRITPIVAARA